MRVLALGEILGSDSITVSDLFAMRQWWREGATFTMSEPRLRSALLYAVGCDILATERGREPLRAPRGALLYVPEGSVYSLRFENRTDDHATVLIELSLDDPQRVILSDKITVLDYNPDAAITDLIERIATEFSRPERNYFEIKSRIFKLLSLLYRRESQSLISERFSSIERGIRYLESDDEQKLSLDEVAAMCFVTPAYFRRTFRKYAGTSPIEYRNRRKAERARELLDSTELSIGEISDILGYESPSYFCRAFKREVGTTPTMYRTHRSIEK